MPRDKLVAVGKGRFHLNSWIISANPRITVRPGQHLRAGLIRSPRAGPVAAPIDYEIGNDGYVAS